MKIQLSRRLGRSKRSIYIFNIQMISISEIISSGGVDRYTRFKISTADLPDTKPYFIIGYQDIRHPIQTALARIDYIITDGVNYKIILDWNSNFTEIGCHAGLLLRPPPMKAIREAIAKFAD